MNDSSTPQPPNDKTPLVVFVWILACFIIGLTLLSLTAFMM